jgi:hypothetical protein
MWPNRAGLVHQDDFITGIIFEICVPFDYLSHNMSTNLPAHSLMLFLQNKHFYCEKNSPNLKLISHKSSYPNNRIKIDLQFNLEYISLLSFADFSI